MNQQKIIISLRNRIRKLTRERDILQVRHDGLKRIHEISGLTLGEEQRLWKLFQSGNDRALEKYLMLILSPTAWMTKEELEELCH